MTKNGVLFGGTTSPSMDSSFIGDQALMISYNDDHKGGTNRVRVITTNDTKFGMDAVLPVAGTAVSTETLYDLVLTYAESTRTFTLYIDGEPVGTGALASRFDLSSIPEYTIGGISNPAFPDDAANASIGSFLVIDGMLTPSQVSLLHRNGPGASLAQINAAGISAASESSSPVVAYYRFENGGPGQSFGNTDNLTISDSSPHGNSFSPSRGPAASPEVPLPAIPQTAAENKSSCHFTGVEDVHGTLGQEASPLVKDFTIEAWVKFDSLKYWQTIVGRDDTGNPGDGIGAAALFYLSKTVDVLPRDRKGLTANAFRVELVTSDNTTLTFDSYVAAETNVWYHLAVVGNAATDTLTLYVNGREAGGTSGYNGLLVPSKNTLWTLGRGQYEGKPIDFLRGYLDEVRFSDTALTPDQFLNAPPKR